MSYYECQCQCKLLSHNFDFLSIVITVKIMTWYANYDLVGPSFYIIIVTFYIINVITFSHTFLSIIMIVKITTWYVIIM